ncbi:MAG: hypothetical protein CBD44_02955 [Flavobacteriaceae bacterium TMED184]|nr:MAG: hypothetical protein CBD44_02955 [Flavobacteriaceae bacterium TMED184]|tara:strand:- start:3915 stop:4289 length:375 start_codon:yes stop_codon:yes gene_type:complete
MNLNLKLIFCCIVFILFGCDNYNNDSVPDNLIEPKKMTNILVDMELLRSIKSTNASDEYKEKALGDLYLYKKYNIDSLQLVESKKYYSKYPKKYLAIYKSVEKRLKFMKDSLNLIMDSKIDKIE